MQTGPNRRGIQDGNEYGSKARKPNPAIKVWRPRIRSVWEDDKSVYWYSYVHIDVLLFHLTFCFNSQYSVSRINVVIYPIISSRCYIIILISLLYLLFVDFWVTRFEPPIYVVLELELVTLFIGLSSIIGRYTCRLLVDGLLEAAESGRRWTSSSRPSAAPFLQRRSHFAELRLFREISTRLIHLKSFRSILFWESFIAIYF